MKIFTFEKLKNAKIEDVKEVIEIASVCPILYAPSNEKEDKKTATLTWLCKDTNDHMFTLQTSYMYNEENKENNVFDTDFILSYNNKTNRHFIPFIYEVVTKYKDQIYVTDMNFNIDTNTNKVYLYVNRVDIGIVGINETIIELDFNLDNFALMSYIDNLIRTENPYDDNLQNIIVRSCNNYKTELFIVNSIKKLSGIYPIGKYTLACKFIVADENDEEYTLLANFAVMRKVSVRKYKKNSIKDYMTDDNQYLLDYKFDSHINNLEKTYTCIRAFNKDNNFKLFLLSDSILDDLEKFINEY